MMMRQKSRSKQNSQRQHRHPRTIVSKSAPKLLCASLCLTLAAFLLAQTCVVKAQQKAARDFSKETARQSPQWVRDGVIYQIFERAFSDKGDFNGVTAQLDRLKDLGVNILWLMPVHPISQVKRKGTLGSPYAAHDYYAINPDYGTKEDLKRARFPSTLPSASNEAAKSNRDRKPSPASQARATLPASGFQA